jgi:hypothetical protein
MTKRIERSRIESGKVELPRKLGFLTANQVDFLSVTDRNGEFSVEMPVAALSKLVKAKSELKALKAEQKSAAAGHVSALQAEKDAHAETQVALAKAERRIKALTKRLEGASMSSEVAAVPQAMPAGEARGSTASQGAASAEAGTPSEGGPLVNALAPAAPRKVSRKKVVAEAAEAVVAPAAAAEGPAALH